MRDNHKLLAAKWNAYHLRRLLVECLFLYLFFWNKDTIILKGQLCVTSAKRNKSYRLRVSFYAGDADTGDDEYRNSDCVVDAMNVYKKGFCKYLSLPTYMSKDDIHGKDNNICKSSWEQLKSFRASHKKQMIFGHLNINSFRNKFFEFIDVLADNVLDIVIFS